VKISDFGVSYFNQHLAGSHSQYDDEIDRELAETAGTPAFFAPELCSSIDTTSMNLVQYTHHITKAIDVWAVGVTLYCLIYGQCPFAASTEFELFDLIPTAPLVFPSKDQVGFETPEELKDLLLQLLHKDPQQRITLDRVKQHPWVIQDLSDPALWWKETDPARYQTVHVTDEEVSRAVTIMDKLRRSIRRISSSLSNLTHPFSSKSSSLSDPSPFSPSSNSSSTLKTCRPLYEEEEVHEKGGWIPKSFTNQQLFMDSTSEEYMEEDTHIL
jgi:serine/threonine protein kinase